MPVLNNSQPIPVYNLTPDDVAQNKNFRVYNYEGSFPDQSELLVPHRKNHYLVVFVKRGSGRQWVDTEPFTLQDNTVYFSGPADVIVKEVFEQLWSIGIAFTTEFLSLQGSLALEGLPIIQNPYGAHELPLGDKDVAVVEDLLAKINTEYNTPGEWQGRMLTAYLAALLTHLSRLYVKRFQHVDASTDKQLLKAFQAKVNECFRELREVADYASLLHLSAGHLSEVVKAQSGKPAIKHIHDRIVLEARRLLFHTDDSLKEIAFGLGFSEASYFNRFFKRETGATPADYRTGTRKMYH